jgi:hypothetical protein
MRQRVETLAAAQPATPPPQSNMPAADSPIGEAAPLSEPAPAPKTGEGYANRLLSAKRRAKEQIREQSEESN